jgi:hypothetical protein
MTVFPTAGHLASWAGTAPGSNESAGRVKSTKTRPGNRYLKTALGTSHLSPLSPPCGHLIFVRERGQRVGEVDQIGTGGTRRVPEGFVTLRTT